MTPPRFHDLLLRWEDGDISSSELDELSNLLTGDPKARQEFLLHSMMTSEINQVLTSGTFRKMNPTGAPPPTRRRASGLIRAALGVRGRWIAVAGVAAAAVLAALVITAWAEKSPSQDAGGPPSAGRRPPSPPSRPSEATEDPAVAPAPLVRPGGLPSGSPPLVPGESLPPKPSPEALRSPVPPVIPPAPPANPPGEAGPATPSPPPPGPADPKPPGAADPDRPIAPVPLPPEPTRTVLATLERMRGEVSILAGGRNTPAALLQSLQSAQGLEVVGPFSEAVVVYADASRLHVGPDSKVIELSDRVTGGPEKRVSFGRGTLAIDLVGQPEASPLLLETPQAEIRSAGAYFTVSAEAESTRIEVGAGKVRVARALDGRALELSGGQFAQVGAAFEFAARPLLRPDKKKKGKKELELETRVSSALRGGLAYLEEAQGTIPLNSPDPGSTYAVEVVLWALERGGVPETDPGLQRLLGQMVTADLRLTYKVALQAVILEDLDRVKYQNRIAQCAQFLVDNQCRNGQWSYGEPVLPADLVPVAGKGRKESPAPGGSAADPSRAQDGREKKDRARVIQRVAVSKRRDGPTRGDNSNSQYAALGLRACSDAGIVFPQEVLKRGQAWWRESQGASKKGEPAGWSYGDPPGPLARTAYGSMTAGAAGSVALYHYLLGEPWTRDDSIQKGLDWITRHFTVTENPFPDDASRKGDPWHFYYLYALERLGVLTGTETFGAHEWYAEGANYLLRAQKPDGSWTAEPEGSARIIDTSLALLFLRRATRPLGDVASVDRSK